MSTLGEWTLQQPIGSGGLAEVWLAHNPDGDEVALKILREPDRSPAHRERFIREGRILMRLNHPGLPRCLGLSDGPKPYLVLERLRGETLAARIKKGKLKPNKVVQVCDALLRIMGYLHERGIVHRDVKASNIYLDSHQRILLLDLGLATDPLNPLLTTLGDVMGTIAYMAPEQLAGAQVDHRCDLYSLGVTLYEALSGQRPFPSKYASSLHAHERDAPPPLSELTSDAPVRLLDTVTRLMARDPADRPSSANIARALLNGNLARRELRQPPLIGRAAAKGAVQAALDTKSTTVLVGEIGSGLRRMGAWALQQANHDGYDVIAIRCRERAHPLDPLYQIARDLERISTPVRPEAIPLATELTALANEGPLLLLIEHADQINKHTLTEFLTLLSRTQKCAILITCAQPMPALTGHHVQLRPLTHDETLAMVSSMLDTFMLPPGLVKRLHEFSGGMPGMVTQTLREMASRGSLHCNGLSERGHLNWTLDNNDPITPTTSLVRMYGDVLSRLPDDTMRLLEVLSVVGESIPLRVALLIANNSPDGMSMGPLLRHGLIQVKEDHEETWLQLRQPAVASLVLNHISKKQIRKIHREVARALISMPASQWRDQLIAWHAAHGAAPAKALHALLHLAETLHGDHRHRQALQVLQQIPTGGSVPPLTRARLAIVHGEVLMVLGRIQEAREALFAGRQIAQEQQEPALTGRALIGLAKVTHRMGLDQETDALVKEALHLPLSPKHQIQGFLLAADRLRQAAKREEAARLYNQTIDLSIKEQMRLFAAKAHGGLGIMLAESGHLAAAAQHFEQQAAFARVHGLSSQLAQTLCRLASCYTQQGRVSHAQAALQEALHHAHQIEDPDVLILVRLAMGRVFLNTGHLDRVQKALDTSRSALLTTSTLSLRLNYRDLQGLYRLRQGDWQAALASFQIAEKESTDAGFTILGGFFLGMIVVLTADPDALLESMDILEEARDHRLSATLLYYGGTIGGDIDVLDFAREEARTSGDRFLLLQVLYAVGGESAWQEACTIFSEIDTHLPRGLQPVFYRTPAAHWCRTNRLDSNKTD